MQHIFVINPKSFVKKADIDAVISQINSFFDAHTELDYTIYLSAFPRDATAVIRKRMKEAGKGQAVRVYAVGGDGILFDCLNGVVGFPNAELASIPYGKSNDFLRAFGEGKYEFFRNISRMVEEKETIPTDLLYYGNNYAINTSSVGLESIAIIKCYGLNQKYRRYLNKFPFLYNFMVLLAGIISLFDQKLVHQYYEINIDGDDYSGNYATINIANGPCYGGSMCAVPTAVPDDGFMDIQLFKSTGTIKMLTVLHPYLHGKQPKNLVVLKRAKKVSIRSAAPLMIQLDGEILIDTNITMELVPRAVKIVTVNGLRYQARANYSE
ncbi:lipid kinase [Spirochaetia bacterium]|nr:lipid kinase [Spirochaetia bacterium]